MVLREDLAGEDDSGHSVLFHEYVHLLSGNALADVPVVVFSAVSDPAFVQHMCTFLKTHPATEVTAFYESSPSSSSVWWSFKPVAGYDWPVEMARLGHVSVSIDRLGYVPNLAARSLVTRHGLQTFYVAGALYTVGGCTTQLRDSQVVERRVLQSR